MRRTISTNIFMNIQDFELFMIDVFDSYKDAFISKEAFLKILKNVVKKNSFIRVELNDVCINFDVGMIRVFVAIREYFENTFRFSESVIDRIFKKNIIPKFNIFLFNKRDIEFYESLLFIDPFNPKSSNDYNYYHQYNIFTVTYSGIILVSTPINDNVFMVEEWYRVKKRDKNATPILEKILKDAMEPSTFGS